MGGLCRPKHGKNGLLMSFSALASRDRSRRRRIQWHQHQLYDYPATQKTSWKNVLHRQQRGFDARNVGARM
ncbi:MAG TPA: hypothetical protein DEF45_08475 [Rhodopirellula sp.]|nr:hypothetical protein [Rhodopirellula sp.]